MGKIKKLIKEKVEYLEAERRCRVERLENNLKLCPDNFHDKYLNSFSYLRADAGIKLCELRIEIWKALMGGKK